MKAFSIWLEASRPKTLIAIISPVTIGSLLAAKSGPFSWITFTFTLLTGLGIQVGTNFANDYFDFLKGADTVDRKGPRRVTQAGLVALPTMKRAVFITFALTALLSSYLTLQGGPLIALLAAGSIILGIGYTAGPWPLAYLGLGDLFVALFFGPVATLGTYYLQNHTMSSPALYLGFGPGFFSTAILTANNLRDQQEDSRSKKKTLCVRWGETFGRIEYSLLVIAGSAIPCCYGYYLPLLTLIPALIPLKTVWSATDKTLFNTTLAQTGKLLLLFTLLLTASIVRHQHAI